LTSRDKPASAHDQQAGRASKLPQRIGRVGPIAKMEAMTDELARALGAHVALTHILVVADIDRLRAFWVDIMGADLYREYGGTSVVLRFASGWLLLVTGGGHTADKPETIFAPPAEGTPVSHAMTVRVADCHGVYAFVGRPWLD
jgi:hypothetical protein